MTNVRGLLGSRGCGGRGEPPYLQVARHPAAVQFGALSPDGRCYTFNARANSYVRGEGGGFVLLKPLAAAMADGDPVYCVIRGSALNNDGGGVPQLGNATH